MPSGYDDFRESISGPAIEGTANLGNGQTSTMYTVSANKAFFLKYFSITITLPQNAGNGDVAGARGATGTIFWTNGATTYTLSHNYNIQYGGSGQGAVMTNGKTIDLNFPIKIPAGTVIQATVTGVSSVVFEILGWEI